MGNRIRKRNCRLKKARYLRFEPLESRLQFAVDYPLFAAETLSMQESDFLAVSQFYDEWLVHEFEFSRSSNANIDGLDSSEFSVSPYAFDDVPTPFEGQYWGLSVGNDTDSTLDSLSGESWLYADDAWLDYTEGAYTAEADYRDLYFGESVLPEVEPVADTSSELAIPISDSVWYGLAWSGQTNVFGLLADPVVFQTTFHRHGPALDVSPTTDDMIQTITLDMIIVNSIIFETPPSQMDFTFGDNLGSHGESTIEFAVSKPDAVQSDLQPREMVGANLGLYRYGQSSTETFYALKSQSSQPQIDIELDAQLPVEKPAIKGINWSSRRDSSMVVASPEHGGSSKSTNVVVGTHMLPEGMLSIGSEQSDTIASTGRVFEADQHFIVQTALICENLNIVVTLDAKDGDYETVELKESDFAVPNRPLELVAAGFVLFVVQSRFRPYKSLKNQWEKWFARFHRPADK